MLGEDMTSAVISSPLGKLELITNHQHLLHLNYRFNEKTSLSKNFTPLQKNIITQLENYFDDATFQFSIPFYLHGTAFQQRVWRALTKIPTCKTWTYGGLAKKLNTHARAVGQACRHNPISIIVPCHRIVSTTHLGGYAGATDGKYMKIKKWLLHHENQFFLA
jgi:methylated-DNA-[protein]-cysteine S-methyltransferase